VSGGKHPKMVFFGDDFTGASDSLEVVAFAGYRSALFLKPPSAAMLEDYPDLDVIGIAGDSRAMSPAEMDRQLPEIFRVMKSLGAPIVHYKVCSTFDSSPSVGSIGRVIEIAHKTFGKSVIPIVAGTPALERYCTFGNLFARYNGDGKVYRIDRHPTMSVHPATPMDEADLAIHLRRQAPISIGKFTVPSLELDENGRAAHLRALIQSKIDAVLFDATSPHHLTRVGQMISEWPEARVPLFVVGSSGVEYALTQWWSRDDRSAGAQSSFDSFAPVDRVLAVSGSASRLTEIQIEQAIKAGFSDFPVEAADLVDDTRAKGAHEELVRRAVLELEAGRSAILHTARGPDDPRIEHMIESFSKRGVSRVDAKHAGSRLLGIRLGHVVRDILARVPLQRLLLAGGDTSSQITQVLGFDALQVAARLTPGVPLCRTLSRHGGRSMEIALKGGQLGEAGFFETGRKGR
jgi:3-oxoisoapionate kinase